MQTDKLQQLRIKKPALVSKITDIIPKLDNKQIGNNIAQLAHEGLSKTIIDLLIKYEINYENLSSLTNEQFNEMTGSNKRSDFNKIIQAYEKVESNKGRTHEFGFKEKLMEILSSLQFEERVTIEEIVQKIGLQIANFPIKSLIDSLCKEKFIEFNPPYVQRYYLKINEYLNGDFPDKEIFMERLRGISPNELREKYGYSRQGIHNIITRVIRRMPEFLEDKKYAVLFQKYSFEEELFCQLFNESKELFEYLNLKYQKGTKSLLEEVYNNKFTESQRKWILRHYHCFIDKNGEIRELSKLTIFEEIVTKFAYYPVEDKDLVEKYNDYVIKNNLPSNYLCDENSIRGLSNRCSTIIRGKSHTYRYYDYDIVSQDMIKRLTELLELEIGVYSMKKLFNENDELMREIDIRSEHELHNLYKRLIDVEQVKYNRMPEFTVGSIEKKDFLLRLFKEYSPVSLTDLLEYMEESYGIRADSTRSFILSNLHEYIDGEMIKTEYVPLTEHELSKLSSLITEPIYTLEEVKKIGGIISEDFEDFFVNNMTLSKIGYTIKNNYVLKNDFSSVDQYFREMILSKGYFYNEHLPIYQSQTFGSVVYNLEKNHDIFKIEKDVYINLNKLSEAKITRDDIDSFKRRILLFMEKDRYFTLFSLRTAGFKHPLEDLGFPDTFYERLIWTFDEFRTIPLVAGYIFKITDLSISLKDFLYDFVLSKRIIKVDDLIENIKSNYGIQLDVSNVLYLLRNTDIYYSNDLYKLYVDKEDYYEEVYE